MIRVAFQIALRHLMARRRQSLALLVGTIIGVAFFLSVSALMTGSEKDFVRRLVDNQPHITVSDEYRTAHVQPASLAYPDALVDIRHLKPVTETRGIRGYHQIVDFVRSQPGVRASAVLVGQVLLSFAGKDVAVSMNGVTPSEFAGVSKIGEYMVEGTLDDLAANPNGIIIGDQLAEKLSLRINSTLNIASVTGQVRTFKIVGLFHTGQSVYDNTQIFAQIKRVQALLNRVNRANSIMVQLDDSASARDLARRIETQGGYKAVSWQEASEDLMATLQVRAIVSYAIVSAVMIVAAFGIYNVFSAVVLQKHRDIAILKAMGFLSRDIELAFAIEGALLGLGGTLVGLPIGAAMIYAVSTVTFTIPGSADKISIPIDWDPTPFLMAAAFAIGASMLAGYWPARKGARVQPVDILRGAV